MKEPEPATDNNEENWVRHSDVIDMLEIMSRNLRMKQLTVDPLQMPSTFHNLMGAIACCEKLIEIMEQSLENKNAVR